MKSFKRFGVARQCQLIEQELMLLSSVEILPNKAWCNKKPLIRARVHALERNRAPAANLQPPLIYAILGGIHAYIFIFSSSIDAIALHSC